MTSNSQSFYQVVLDALGKTYRQADAASVLASLTLPAGSWDTNNVAAYPAVAQQVGGSITGGGTLQGTAAGNQELISVGANFTVGTYTSNGTRLLLTGAT